MFACKVLVARPRRCSESIHPSKDRLTPLAVDHVSSHKHNIFILSKGIMPTKMITRADLDATFHRAAPLLPPGANIPSQQQHQSHQIELQNQAKKREEAKNKSSKPVDRDLPAGLDDLVIGDGVQHYNRLRDVERRLDATMMRKRLDISDPVYRGPKRYGTMRIWISNTVKDQPWQDSNLDPTDAFNFDSGVEPTYRVKIEGRLLDTAEESEADGRAEITDAVETDENDDGERAAKRTKLSPNDTPRKKFSRYFKSITIDLDRNRSLQPDNWTRIEWHNVPPGGPQSQLDPAKEANFDSLEFQRKGDENINVVVKLVKDERPERYKLGPGLAELLDMEEADRLTLMTGMWEYIRSAGLHAEDDHRRIVCDAKLREVCFLYLFVRC